MGETVVKKSKRKPIIVGKIDDFQKAQDALFKPKKIKADMPKSDFTKGSGGEVKPKLTTPKPKVEIGFNPFNIAKGVSDALKKRK